MENTTYSLSMFNEPDFRDIRNFKESEFLKYKSYATKLVQLKNDEYLFKIVELNYEDLIAKIDSTLSQLSGNEMIYEEQEFLHLEINRLILNLLSSIRTYLDHTETRFKRVYGENSDEFKLFKAKTSEAYDNHFAYRFLYKLRNFSQHCGLPAGNLSISAVNEKETSKHSLNLSLLREDLLQNFEWGNPITEELRNQDEVFDILSLIQSKFKLLSIINDTIKNLAYKHSTEEGHTLLNLLQSIENKDGVPCLLKKIHENRKLNLTIVWFPMDTITKITGIKLY